MSRKEQQENKKKAATKTESISAVAIDLLRFGAGPATSCLSTFFHNFSSLRAKQFKK